MDIDPKATFGFGLTGHRPRGDEALPPTEDMAESLLKGRYLLGPELGCGGFAVTYTAVDLAVASRKVVVKVLNEHHASDSWSLRKFKSEMEALARIDHPNVVSVLDYGYRTDGKPFLIMQHVPGGSLRLLIRREGISLSQLAQIVKQTGRALTAAHEAGVCHRDLKPENILIQSDGYGEEQVKLIDFGIASIREASADSSATSLAGTYSYMAPEQFQGKSSFASDIFQMGVVAYELVTGIKPFPAPTPGGIVLQQMAGIQILPRQLRPDLPEKAQEAILKAMSPDPQDRYERARDFGDALTAALDAADLEAPEWVKTASHGRSSARSNQFLIAKLPVSRWLLFAALLVVVLGVSAHLIWYAGFSSVSSVAVLPFQNRTSENASGNCARFRAEVRPPQSRSLGVARVVDGSMSRQGNVFLLDTELIDVYSGVRLWGYSYTGKISSLAEVVQQFSREVTDQLRLKLSGSLKNRLKRQYATGSQSYQQYLKGRFHLNKRTAADFQEAIRYFNQAIAADSA